jgi:hypothetical protein
MAVELAHEMRFETPPQAAWTQVRPVIRAQLHVAPFTALPDPVRPAKRKDAALDPQTLLDHFELDETRPGNGGDSLYYLASAIVAPHRCPGVCLAAFGSHGFGQQGAKQQGWALGHLFVEEDTIPDRFRAGVEVRPRRHRFVFRFAR